MERLSLTKDEQLDEFIRDGKLKPALKLIETKHKKGDKSDWLLIRKIIVLFSYTDDGHKQQAVKELEGLVSRKPHITDHQALKRLDLFLAGSKDRDDFSNNMWAVAGAASTDEEFLSTWFHLKFDQERWEAAQKAAQTWQKLFPRNRTPFYLWILSLHIASTQPDIEDVPRKLAQGLSFKLLAKAVADVPTQKDPKNKSSPSPTRALNTEQDLLLLLEIYISQHKYLEALRILEDQRTGFVSDLSTNKWEIVRYMIGLHELAENWKGEWDLCSAILVNAKPDFFDKGYNVSTTFNFGELGDDWRVWDGLITSCGKLSNGPDASDHINRTETIIDGFGKAHNSRNSALAKLKMHSIMSLTQDSHQEILLSLCQNYFEKFGSKVICFQDLRPHVSYLSRENHRQFREHLESFASRMTPSSDTDKTAWLRWITYKTNMLKFDYQVVTKADNNASSEMALPAFVRTCLQLYRKSLEFDFCLPQSDRLPSDDAVILAAMALTHMYTLREKYPAWSFSLHRCLMLLELVLRHSKHNYDSLLVLVRIYAYIGAESLALARYQRLSIKNIQNMTLPWMLYTRFSSMNPHPLKVEREDGSITTIDPFDEITHILNWYQRAYQLNRDSMEDFCSNNQWVMELDALETKSSLQNSFCRLILVAESSRIRRFRHLKEKIQDDDFHVMRLCPNIKDSRDLTAFPNYEHAGQSNFWTLCESLDGLKQTRPNEKWLGLNLRQTLLWDRLNSNDKSSIKVGELQAFLDHYENQSDTCSDPEKTLFKICGLLLECFEEINHQAGKGGLLAGSVGQILLQIDKVNKEWAKILEMDEDPAEMHLGANLHAGFCALEMCQFVTRFAAVVQKLDRSEAWMTKMLADLRDGCQKLSASVSTKAKKDRSLIQSPSFSDCLREKCSEDDEVGRELNQMIDTKSWDGYSKRLRESWIDALDGLIKTKVAD